jgi:hypothetical protein
MKTFPTTALMLAAMLSLASADVIELTTTNGRTYKQCRIVKMETDGVSFPHANGAGKVLFKGLTKDLHEHFDYDSRSRAGARVQAEGRLGLGTRRDPEKG